MENKQVKTSLLLGRQQKGVALIITIILSGIMLTSVAFFAKEMLDEVKASTRIDNSLVAYYAAEAGLEEALLEFRYDRSAEISWENDNNPDVDVTENQNNTPRCVNLDNNSRINPSQCGKEYLIPYFAVKMWYKTPSITDLTILKDDVVEMEIPNMTQDVTIEWDWDITQIPPDSGFRMEITVYDGETGEIIPKEGLFDEFDRQITDSKEQYGGKFFTEPDDYPEVTLEKSKIGPGKKIVRIRPWYTKRFPLSTDPDDPHYNIYTQGSCNTGTEGSNCRVGIDNVVPAVVLSVNKTPTPDLIGAPFTYIESLGYYGGVIRKITAKIDRSSGKILGIFDFVIYSASELVK